MDRTTSLPGTFPATHEKHMSRTLVRELFILRRSSEFRLSRNWPRSPFAVTSGGGNNYNGVQLGNEKVRLSPPDCRLFPTQSAGALGSGNEKQNNKEKMRRVGDLLGGERKNWAIMRSRRKAVSALGVPVESVVFV